MNKINYSKYIVFILIGLLTGCTNEEKGTSSGDTTLIQDTVGSNDRDILAEPVLKKYDLRSGIISFEVQGRESGSSKIVYFDDFGNKEVSYIYSRNKISEKWINKNDGSFYTLNYENKTGAKRKASRPGTEERFDIEEMPLEMQEENKVKQYEDSVFAGKSCKVYSMESGGIKTTKAGWAHIILMIGTEVAHFKYRTVAKTMEENVPIPDSVYAIPENFNIKEF
jgi:hypothetical protein